MSKSDLTPFDENANSLTGQLKVKSRRRRRELVQAPPPRSARNDLLPALEITYLSLQEIRPPLHQVRKIDPAHVREVAASINALGFCTPVLIGADNVTLDGQIRLEAARALGLARVPCVRIDHLSENEQRVLRLAVNRLGEKGEWDLTHLKIELEELIFGEAPIEITGFSPDEIDQILVSDNTQILETGPLEPADGAVAIARVGDMFELGSHRLVCGDATNSQVFSLLMNGDPPARLILTDEPYNVPIVGHVSGGKHREFKMASGEMTNAEFLAFNEAWIEGALPFLCDGGVFGTFIDWRGQPIVHCAATKRDLEPLNLIVWIKTNAGMGSLYRSQHELLPLFKKGSSAHINNIELGKRGRWRSNVWTYPGASSVGSEARRGLRHHPTVKPTTMLEDALLDLTKRNDIVIDPFLGSGSTLVAAEKTGRVCRGIEIDPLYVDVIIRRYEAVTGKAAILTETSETFEALARRRTGELRTGTSAVA